MSSKTSMQTYENTDFGSIRVSMDGSDVWFVASDVARVLGYRMAADMIRYLNDDEKGTRKARTPGGEQTVTVINEPGFYHALNMRRTACMKNPEARERVEAFQRWVNHEVLPSIRRNGAYVNPAGAETPEELIARALRAANEIIAKREQRIAALETETQELRPRAAFAEAVEGANTSILIRDLARMLTQNGFDIGQNSLFKLLRKDGYLIRAVGRDRNQPTRRSMEMGLMEVKETAIQTSHGAKVRITPLVTGKGQVYFLRKYAGIGGDEQ